MTKAAPLTASIVALSAVFALGATSAKAEGPKVSYDRFFSVGDWTVQGGAAASAIGVEDNGNSETAAVGNIGFEVGYFVTDNVALGLGAGVSIFDFGQVNATSFGLEPRASCFFDGLEHVVPYVGVQGGYGYFDVDTGTNTFDDDALTYGAHVGVAIPLNGYNFIDLRAQYSRIDFESYGVEIDHTLLVGAGYRMNF